MWTSKRFLVFMLCALLCAPVVSAQDQPREASGKTVAAQDVTIIIQQQQVLFKAPLGVEEMRLQVFDQSGETVFDSGVSSNTELIWPLRNGSGSALKSGLYAYALSMKATGTETARMRRGHFIVDRAQDRDGATDKLWVTSQSEGDVGAELTLAKDEHAVIAGTAMRSDNTNSGDLPTRGSTPTGEEKQNDVKSQKSEVAAPAATVGQIAKFTTATVVGDSVMTEANGNIGIGTLTPANKLEVNGGIRALFNTSTGVVAETTGGTNAWARFHMNTLSQRWFIGTSNNFNGNQFYLWDETSNQGRLTIQPSGGAIAFPLGNVGIGLTDPSSRMVVRAGGSGGDVHFGTPSGESGMGIIGNNRADVRFDGKTLKLLAGTGPGAMASTNGIAINTGGNVGIGTVDPATKLHIEGTGFVVSTIKSTNQTAVLSLNSSATDKQQIWNIESGIFGNTNMFGIYDATAQKPRLTIDKDGVVAVTTLRINGGADFAENFEVRAAHPLTSAGTPEIQPGMVVTIDPSNPGKLNLSRREYDRRVAGIISGAGGVKTGMTMGQADTLADGKHPVALTGRVYCWVDATRGAIKPGDLLTTAVTPGHAMKAANSARAQGAIIGKAMTALKSGKGLVLVLVTLQ